MKFIYSAYLIKKSKEVNALQSASEQLFSKITSLDISDLNISEYSRVYFEKHQTNLKYLLQNYTYILFNLQKEVGKPFEEISVIDHGAGIGVLSFLCKQLGMDVISNDIYGEVLKDSEVISNALGMPEGSYHHGSIKELARQCEETDLNIDAVISSEVIEHIYDLNEFFDDLCLIPSSNLNFVFSTSANIKNLLRRKKLEKLQIDAELNGDIDYKGRKKKDSILPYLEIRKNIIKENFPGLSRAENVKLGKLTRGLKFGDIVVAVENYIMNGIYPKELNHKTNTCDPITGNWTEHLFPPENVKEHLIKKGVKSRIIPGYYGIGEDNSRLTRLIKNGLNILISISTNYGVYISHSWLIISKK